MKIRNVGYNFTGHVLSYLFTRSQRFLRMGIYHSPSNGKLWMMLIEDWGIRAIEIWGDYWMMVFEDCLVMHPGLSPTFSWYPSPSVLTAMVTSGMIFYIILLLSLYHSFKIKKSWSGKGVLGDYGLLSLALKQ